MKKILAFVFTVVLCSTFSFAQTTNINGLWADSAGTSLKKAYAIFSQNGDKIHFSHYLEFNNQPFVEYGEGNIIGNQVVYKVDVTLPIAGWATAGIHQLKLSADGKKLKGFYTDNKGNTGPIVFVKQ